MRKEEALAPPVGKGGQILVVEDERALHQAGIQTVGICRTWEWPPGGGPPGFVDARQEGLEVMWQMKVDPRVGNIPVVVLTSSREEQGTLRVWGKDLRIDGVTSHLSRPVNSSRLSNEKKNPDCLQALIQEPPPGSGPVPP